MRTIVGTALGSVVTAGSPLCGSRDATDCGRASQLRDRACDEIVPIARALGTVRCMSAYEQVPVAAPPAEAVETIRALLRERGITEYAVVDHGHDMEAAGVPG